MDNQESAYSEPSPPLPKEALDDFYFYWDSNDFKKWAADGLIPKELLEPSRVIELHNYIIVNRDTLASKCRKAKSDEN